MTVSVRSWRLVYALDITSNQGRSPDGTHRMGTHEEWLAARLDLLQAEKELTRRSDELARRPQELS